MQFSIFIYCVNFQFWIERKRYWSLVLNYTFYTLGFQTSFCGPLLVPESKFVNIRSYGSGPREDILPITGTTYWAASQKSLKTTVLYHLNNSWFLILLKNVLWKIAKFEAISVSMNWSLVFPKAYSAQLRRYSKA